MFISVAPFGPHMNSDSPDQFGDMQWIALKVWVSRSPTPNPLWLWGTPGTNPRPVLKGCIQRTSAGTSLLVQDKMAHRPHCRWRPKGTLSGAVISYHSFEAQTWAHRKKAGWAAFNRVRAWAQNRQLPIAKRLYLWKTCAHTVLTYGLLSVHVTLPVLHEYQVTVYQMIRMILGDHPYATHHTHQQVFQLYGLAPPLDLLSTLAMGLLRRIHRREQLLQPDDFLRRLDWSHLHDV